MSHQFQTPADTLEEEQGQRRPAGSRLADFGDRIARAFAGSDRGRVDQLALESGGLSRLEFPDDEEARPDLPPRFPVGPFGYNRAIVDEHIAELERELDDLRQQRPAPMSINEEIERIGEQTASILVVAHDQARETTRLAQEQADRCIADAAANAVTITEQAKQRLRQLDNETDSVWRERRRLIDDVQRTGDALISLASEGMERFPEETKTATRSMDELPG
jgi:hypothetical protein